MQNIYTPNDFKHLDSDSKMIQAAVDEAAKYGVKVVIPRVNERTNECKWELEESIKLHTGSYVLLDNCYIRLKDDTYIHFFENDSADDFGEWYLSKNRQYDIQLVGEGNVVLDGGKHNGIFEKDFNIYDENGNFVKSINYKGLPSIAINRGLEFRNVERITVKGLRFINIRYWAMCFEFCSYGHIADINFEALGNVPNQDGIDIRVGCNNFLVENIYGLTGDDTIALTNFAGRFLETSDMDTSIHDIIISNVRSYQSDNCDIIRILNRGGGVIYNIQISNVVDITPEYKKDRALAAIRIGDICDYPQRLNTPGETRNIIIRDVVTRARFGAYIANTVVDSTFDNFMMTSDGGIGIYFNGCYIENVYINKFMYNTLHSAPESDIGYQEVFHRVKIDTLNALHFNNCEAKNLNVTNLVTGKNLTYAFGGNSEIEIKTKNVVMLDENTKLAEKPIIVNL